MRGLEEGRGESADPGLRVIGVGPVAAPSLTDEVARQLHEAIVLGRLRPGERLSEAALSREMQVSRASIREAQRQLERQGLLTFQPRRGFFVRQLTPAQIDDIFSVRAALEAFAVEQAIEVADDVALARLATWRDAVVARDAQSALGPRDLVEQDLALHRLIAGLSGSEALAPLFDALINQVRLGLSLVNLRFESGAHLARRHDDIVDALLARDAPRAIAAMRAHLDRSREALR